MAAKPEDIGRTKIATLRSNFYLAHPEIPLHRLFINDQGMWELEITKPDSETLWAFGKDSQGIWATYDS